MNIKKYIGNKKFYKSIFALIIPIMLQQLLISVAGYIDNIMINNYTPNSIAYNGVSAANRLIFVLNFIWLGFATVSSIFIAQFFGSGNQKKNEETFRLGFYISIIVGIISTLIIIFFGNSVVNAYIESSESRAFGYEYLKYIKYGTIITVLNIFFANCFRTIEKAKIALASSTIGIITNIFFNYCFIYGNLGFPELGAGGAAIATTISRAFELLVFVYFLFIDKKSYFKHSFSAFFVTKLLFTDYVKKGVPLVLNEVFWSMGMVLLAKFYTYKNDIWYAAYSYSQNISDLFFIIFAGLGSGTAIVIGADLGQNNFDKALDDFDKLKGLSVFLGITLGLLMIALSPLIIKLFNPTEEIRKLTIYLVMITGIFTGIYCYNSVSFFTMRAGGDSIRAFILDETPTYLISLPLAIILGTNAEKFGLNVVTIYLISHSADLFKLWLSNYFTSKKKWLVNLTLKHKTIEE